MDRFITRSSGIALLFIIGLATVLRLYHLDFNPLWIDEAATLQFSTGSFAEIWQYTAAGEFNPPGFHWIVNLVITALGVSEFSLRLVPMLAGILTVPVAYCAATVMANDRRVGLIVAFLITCSPFHLYYSQEARAYTAMLLLYTIGLTCYLLWVKTTRPAAMPATRYLLYLAMGAFGVAVWMHFYAVIAILPILIHMLFQHIVFGYLEYGDSRGVDRGFFLASGIFAICVVPFLTIGPALFGRRTGMGVVWGADPLMMVTDIFVEMAGFHILFALLFILLAVVGMRHYCDPSFAAFVPLTIIVPLIISAILAPHMDLSVRYLIFLIPVFYTLVGTGIVDVVDQLTWSPLPLLCIVGLFIILINAPTLATYYTDYTKIDYRGAATYLTDATNDGDIVLLIPQSRESAFTFYYTNTTDNTRYLPLQFGTEAERLNEIVRMPGTIWLVRADVRECLDPDAPINRWLADRGIAAQQTYKWISIYQVQGGA